MWREGVEEPASSPWQLNMRSLFTGQPHSKALEMGQTSYEHETKVSLQDSRSEPWITNSGRAAGQSSNWFPSRVFTNVFAELDLHPSPLAVFKRTETTCLVYEG